MFDGSIGREIRSLSEFSLLQKMFSGLHFRVVCSAERLEGIHAAAAATVPEQGLAMSSVMQFQNVVGGLFVPVKIFGKSQMLDDRDARYTLAFKQGPSFLQTQVGKVC